MNFSGRRAFAIARKEVHHILRDPLTFSLAAGLPVFLVCFFGFVIDFDVRDIRLALYDRDHTRASRSLADVFTASRYFKVLEEAPRERPLAALDSQKAAAVLIVEPRFGRDLGAGKPVRAQVILDGADNSTAGVLLSYLAGVQGAALAKLRPDAVHRERSIDLQTRFLFNPELNSRWFTIPGLLVVVMSILSVLLTALTVAREWETGSMELLLSTPVRPFEIILGKLVPYVFLGLFSVLLVYGAARLVFGVPFEGSHFLFALACLIFLGTTLAQGLLISVLTRQQQLAMQLGIVSGLLPSLLLSGFIFSITNMPVFFRYFTAVLPARWFMAILRGIFLRGAGPIELAVPFAALMALSTLLVLTAHRRFKKDLEP